MSVWESVRQWPRRIAGLLSGLERGALSGGAFESPKRQWPPARDVSRIGKYSRNAKLYLGQHEQVFVTSGEFRFEYDESREYVHINLLKALSDVVTWRLFGEGIDVLAPEGMGATGEFFEHLYTRNGMRTLNLRAGLGASYRGDAVYKVRYDPNGGRVVVETVNPAQYFPEVDCLNGERVTAATVAQVLWDDDQQPYLWQERHELRGGAGWVTNRLFTLHGDVANGEMYVDLAEDEVGLGALPQTSQLPAEIASGVDRLLLVHVPNKTSDETGIWGISDYDGLVAIQGEYNNRLTQRAEVLDKFVDPFMYGPDISDEKGQVNLRENKWFTLPEGALGTGNPVGMLTWDAQLGAVVAELDELRQQFAVTAGVDLTALADLTGGPVSGRALRLSQMKTQATVQAKQMHFGPGLQEVFSIASKLAAVQGRMLGWQPSRGCVRAVEPEAVGIVFGDALPADRAEDIEEQVAMLDAGVQDALDAIKLLHGLGDEDARAKLARIRQDQAEMSSVGLPAELLSTNPLGGGEG